MILKIAWHNIWRNKLRSIVLLLAVFTGLSGGLFAMAFARGAVNQLLAYTIDVENPHLSLQHPCYAENKDIYCLLPDADDVASLVSDQKGVSQTAVRIMIPAIAATAHSSSNVIINGIDPQDERELSSLWSLIEVGQGSFFEDQTSEPVVVGRQLANELNLKLNARLILSFQALSGEMVSAVFHVGGIFSYQNASYEGRQVFVLRDELAALAGIPASAGHVIAVRLEDGVSRTEQMHEELTLLFPDTDVVKWNDMRPEIGFFFSYVGLLNTVIVGVILLALSLGVINTMLMIIIERTPELGVLRAIGMSNQRVGRMVFWETLFLLALGSLMSLLFSWVFLSWLNQVGIDMSVYVENYNSPAGEYQSILTMVPRVHPVFAMADFLRVSLMVILTGLIAAIFPIRKALQINPAQATKLFR
jgi:putative ABC transport system permease protein